MILFLKPHFTNIKAVVLTSCSIQNAFFLSNMKGIEYLNLGHNKITELYFLKHFQLLQDLILNNNCIENPATLRWLCCKRLRCVDLTKNPIGKYLQAKQYLTNIMNKGRTLLMEAKGRKLSFDVKQYCGLTQDKQIQILKYKNEDLNDGTMFDRRRKEQLKCKISVIHGELRGIERWIQSFFE